MLWEFQPQLPTANWLQWYNFPSNNLFIHITLISLEGTVAMVWWYGTWLAKIEKPTQQNIMSHVCILTCMHV